MTFYFISIQNLIFSQLLSSNICPTYCAINQKVSLTEGELSGTLPWERHFGSPLQETKERIFYCYCYFLRTIEETTPSP